MSRVGLFDHPVGRYPTMEAFLKEAWEGRFVANWDANDMLVLLNTWQRGDISLVRDGGDFTNALRSITAKALIMPCKTDLYFCVCRYIRRPLCAYLTFISADVRGIPPSGMSGTFGPSHRVFLLAPEPNIPTQNVHTCLGDYPCSFRVRSPKTV